MREAAKRAQEPLSDLGRAAREAASGGAVGRRVADATRGVLADEPTGSLDPKTAGHMFGTLTELVKTSRVAALVATHNLDLAARMDRRVTLRDVRMEEKA